MKKLSFCLLAAAGLMTAACSSDEPTIDGGAPGYADGKVTFAVAMPGGIDSRAVADGLSATDLAYVVYDEEGEFLFEETKAAVFSGKETTVQIPLVTGKKYQVAFVATSPEAPYTVSEGVLALNYSTDNANADTYDAFYKLEPVAVEKGMAQQQVVLKRPFAQVNVGATDWEAAKKAGYVVAETGLSFTAEVYTSMDLLTAEASDPAEVTFALSALPDATGADATLAPAKLTVADAAYDYMAMAYILPVLTDDQSSLVNTVTFSYQGPDQAYDIPVNAVPVQRNHRTNIVGRFFTQDVDYKIIIDEQFDEPDFDVEIWEGNAKAPVAADYDVTAKTLNITGPGQLLWFAQAVNAGDTQIEGMPANFKGWTVTLTSDIDLANTAWTPIGTNADDSKKFQGTFDGENHTISNLYINQGAAYHAAGLFGALNGVLQNLNINGAEVSSLSAPGSTGLTDNGTAVVAGSIYNTGRIINVNVTNAKVNANRYAGVIVGYCYGNVEGCSVDGATVVATPDNLSGEYDNGDKAGIIIGYQGEGYNIYGVVNNTAKNSSVKGYRDVAPIIGAAQGGCKIEGNHAENCEVVVDQQTNAYGAKTPNAGTVIGRNLGGYDLSAVGTATNVTISIVATPETLANLVKTSADGTTLHLAAGEYAVPTGAGDKSFTFVGEGKESVMKVGGQPMVGKGSYTFENMKIEYPDGNYTGIQAAAKLTFNDCVIEGVNFHYTKVNEYNRCTINADGNVYPIWTYASTDVTINDCVFNHSQKGKAVLIYGDTDGLTQKIAINNTVFNTNAASGDKCAVEIHSEHNYNGVVTIDNCKVNGAGWNAENGGLWREVDNSKGENGEPTTNYTVIVDGQTVQTSTYGK